MDREQKLLEIKKILEQHKGAQSAISAGKIGKMLGLKQEDTHVEPRQLIWEAINKFKIPVAAGGKGYYFITKEEELEKYCKTLASRANKDLERGEIIKKIFYDYYK